MYPPLFGRNDANPYRDVLDGWWSLKDDDVAYAAMSRNLAYDHRVSVKRAEKFDQIGMLPRTADDLRGAIDDYSEKCVRKRPRPDYLFRGINGNNIVIGGGEKLPPFSKDLKLVRVLDLTGLEPVFMWARQPKNNTKRWRYLLTTMLGRRSGDWATQLDEQLLGKSSDQVEGFIETVLDILDSSRKEVPFQPTWATMWSDFEQHLKYGPDRWLQVLGMAKLPPRWLILLRYTVREVGTLVRPTQLDAGWQEYHFPSPPAASLTVAGHPMDLRVNLVAVPLLREFIHKQIKHTIDHWIDLGGQLGRTTVPTTEVLDRQRAAHYDRLLGAYDGVADWMDSPI
jgi:hypothetical protein